MRRSRFAQARESRWARSVFTDRTHPSDKLLVGLLALLGYLRATAGRFRFGFLLCRVAVCFCLVLLGLALASEVVATLVGNLDLSAAIRVCRHVSLFDGRV